MPWTMTKEVWNIHPGVLVPKEKNKCEFLLLGESRGYGLRTELYPLEGPGHRGGHTLGPRMHSLHKTAAQLARHRTVPLPTMMDTLHCQPHCLESPRQHTSRRASEGFSREKELKDEKPLRPRVLISSCLGPRLNKKEAKSVAVSIPLCFLAHRDATWFFYPAFLSTRKPADTGGPNKPSSSAIYSSCLCPQWQKPSKDTPIHMIWVTVTTPGMSRKLGVCLWSTKKRLHIENGADCFKPPEKGRSVGKWLWLSECHRLVLTVSTQIPTPKPHGHKMYLVPFLKCSLLHFDTYCPVQDARFSTT